MMMSNEYTALIVPGVLWCLVIFSIISWSILLIKGLQFFRDKIENRRFQNAFWQAGSLDEGKSLSENRSGTMAAIARAGFSVHIESGNQAKGRVLSDRINRLDRLERGLKQQIQRERRSLEGGLAILASIGSTSPFIGLFGTVWGIMDALVQIGETGEAGLDTVAGPIGHALIATGVGIAVAVPAVLIYNYFTRRLKLAVSMLDDFAYDFYSLIQQAESNDDDVFSHNRKMSAA